MKRLFLLIALPALVFSCTTEQQPEPVTKVQWFTMSIFAPEYLNGQVKSYEQKAYWATEENGEFVQGALMTGKERDSIGWVDDHTAYFDENGLVVKTEWIRDGKVVDLDEPIIEDGKYVGAKFYRKDTLRTSMKISLDEAGNYARMEQYRHPEDTLINSYTYKWDENGNWIGGQWSNYLGEPGWSHEFTVNEKGLTLATNNSHPDGKISWNKFTYDENGFNTFWEGMNSDSTTISITAKYPKVDEKGNWLWLVSIEDGEVVGMDVRIIEYY